MKTPLAFALALTLGTVGCAKQHQPTTATVPEDKSAQRSSEGTVSDPNPDGDPDLAVASIIAVDIDKRLAELCGITEIFFKYDSAALSEEAKVRLDTLASCLTVGPGKNKDLVVVGRASPPGAEEHNQDLSESRAESVAKYLRAMGVNRSRVEIEGKGEREASAEVADWPLERRVSVRLQD